MMSEREVFITGAGTVSALGRGVGAAAGALRSCRSGISLPDVFRTAHRELPVGEVKIDNADLRGLLAKHLPVPRVATRAALLGMLALDEALANAGLSPDDCRHAVLISATAVGGMDETEKYYPGPVRHEDNLIRFHDCGAVTDAMAERYGGFAMRTTVSTACSASLNAIIFGCDLIRSGRAGIVVAGGTECLTGYHLNGFNSLRILDTDRCRPFDKSRNGLNLGEGAGFVVLESRSSVLRRNAVPVAAVAGYANRCDSYHQTASSPSGEGAFLCMKAALDGASLSPGSISYINAHGTETPNNDLSEGRAVERVFGSAVPPISSTKAFTGHTTAASGAIESIFSLIAMAEGFLPVSLGFSERMDELSFDPVTDGRTSAPLERVMVNAFGFGGNDSCIIYENL